MGYQYTLFIYEMSYIYFFNNLQKILDYRSDIEKNTKILGINPIIIFSGLYLGNIINIFKL